jgi:hypothetical protein
MRRNPQRLATWRFYNFGLGHRMIPGDSKKTQLGTARTMSGGPPLGHLRSRRREDGSATASAWRSMARCLSTVSRRSLGLSPAQNSPNQPECARQLWLCRSHLGILGILGTLVNSVVKRAALVLPTTPRFSPMDLRGAQGARSAQVAAAQALPHFQPAQTRPEPARSPPAAYGESAAR